jgi:hypothetical protein
LSLEDLLDDRLLKDRRNDLELAAAVWAVLHRKDVHGFTERPPESVDPEAAARQYPQMAGKRHRDRCPSAVIHPCRTR